MWLTGPSVTCDFHVCLSVQVFHRCILNRIECWDASAGTVVFYTAADQEA